MLDDVDVYNFVFDVMLVELINVIIIEKGLIWFVIFENICVVFGVC